MEVLIAVAIVALAALPILALLSVAIDSSREAFSTVNKSRIGAELIGEIQQASWTEVTSWHGKEFYYDGDGQRLPDGPKEDAVYTASVRIKSSRAGTILGPTTASANSHLKQLLVAVSNKPGALGSEHVKEALDSPTQKNQGIDFYRAVLVNSQK